MALYANHISNSGGTHRMQRSGQLPHLYDHRDTNSIYSTVTSANSPSIIGLENLRLQPSKEYIVETSPTPNSLTYHPVTKASHAKAYKPHQTSQWENRQKTTVYVNVVFLKIGEIETIKEYFEADVYIQAKWREPSLDKRKVNVSDLEKYWNPELVLQNVFEDPKEQLWYDVRYTEHSEAYIYEMRRVKGKFFETMELNEFPFDVQSISIVISSELTKAYLDIVEDKDEISSIYVDCFSDSQEWELHNFVELDPLDISSQYTHARANYPGIIATCCVARRAGFFAWNVLVIVNLLTIFAFTTFAVSESLPQNRLQLSFILMLAGISFRFVTNQSIPKISYLTHLDRYVLVSMLFSGLITLWHAFLTRFDHNVNLQHTMDFWALIVFALAYFCFQLIFIVTMLHERHRKLKEIRNREKKYKFRAQSVIGDVWGAIREEVTGTVTSLGANRKPSIHNRPR